MDDNVHLAPHTVIALIPPLPRDVAAHEKIVLEVALEEGNEGVSHSVMAPAASRAEGIAIKWMERCLLQVSGVTQSAEGPVAWVAHWINQQAEPQRLDKLRWDIAEAAIGAPTP
jgi:hypothetical protein